MNANVTMKGIASANVATTATVSTSEIATVSASVSVVVASAIATVNVSAIVRAMEIEIVNASELAIMIANAIELMVADASAPKIVSALKIASARNRANAIVKVIAIGIIATVAVATRAAALQKETEKVILKSHIETGLLRLSTSVEERVNDIPITSIDGRREETVEKTLTRGTAGRWMLSDEKTAATQRGGLLFGSELTQIPPTLKCVTAKM